ncbi:hypothetical protein EDEG_00619 [Edhazardia aedis USNM 41457]|uniref:EamA domain-containing protein n=1 Tax=Edhazardia aedis (strain USNM 41457) TaxID=1003232 RepID=J9DC49_EDHAE|nr:hypothetical protein EDEG_00619 [Edhazardia aedis USNM 41457]|eukprot:EJW05316.1 hypothetical protein EDEG_00619 [Edhazardia aedis USNM 41457]
MLNITDISIIGLRLVLELISYYNAKIMYSYTGISKISPVLTLYISHSMGTILFLSDIFTYRTKYFKKLRKETGMNPMRFLLCVTYLSLFYNLCHIPKFYAMNYISDVSIVSIYSSSVISTYLFAVMILSSSMQYRGVFGAILGTFGLILLLIGDKEMWNHRHMSITLFVSSIFAGMYGVLFKYSLENKKTIKKGIFGSSDEKNENILDLIDNRKIQNTRKVVEIDSESQSQSQSEENANKSPLTPEKNEPISEIYNCESKSNQINKMVIAQKDCFDSSVLGLNSQIDGENLNKNEISSDVSSYSESLEKTTCICLQNITKNDAEEAIKNKKLSDLEKNDLNFFSVDKNCVCRYKEENKNQAISFDKFSKTQKNISLVQNNIDFYEMKHEIATNSTNLSLRTNADRPVKKSSKKYKVFGYELAPENYRKLMFMRHYMALTGLVTFMLYWPGIVFIKKFDLENIYIPTSPLPLLHLLIANIVSITHNIIYFVIVCSRSPLFGQISGIILQPTFLFIQIVRRSGVDCLVQLIGCMMSFVSFITLSDQH